MEYWSSRDTEKDKNELIEKKNNIFASIMFNLFSSINGVVQCKQNKDNFLKNPLSFRPQKHNK
jgi:hypothetical protein